MLLEGHLVLGDAAERDTDEPELGVGAARP